MVNQRVSYIFFTFHGAVSLVLSSGTIVLVVVAVFSTSGLVKLKGQNNNNKVTTPSESEYVSMPCQIDRAVPISFATLTPQNTLQLHKIDTSGWYRMIWCFAIVTQAVVICLFVAHDVYIEGFVLSTPQSQHHHPHKGIGYSQRASKRRRSSLYSAPEGLCWFVKTEQFCKPFPEVKPHLEAHREWVRSIRELENSNQQQQSIVSGYRVDEFDRPGGGGLMIFAAKDYEAAEKFVMNDPLVANECVDWKLNKWIAETGDISIE